MLVAYFNTTEEQIFQSRKHLTPPREACDCKYFVSNTRDGENSCARAAHLVSIVHLAGEWLLGIKTALLQDVSYFSIQAHIIQVPVDNSRNELATLMREDILRMSRPGSWW